VNFLLAKNSVVKIGKDKQEPQYGGVYFRGRKDAVTWSFPQAVPSMHASCSNTELRSLLFRHCAEVGTVNEKVSERFYSKMLKFLISKFHELLPLVPKANLDDQTLKDIQRLLNYEKIEPTTHEYYKKWLSSFPPSKRRDKEVEYERCLEDPERLTSEYSVPDRKLFVKREKESLTKHHGIFKYPDGRGIQAYDPLTNVRLGPLITRIQTLVELVFFHLRSAVSFACGMNGDDVSDLFQKLSASNRVMMDDFTLYDTTFNKTMHRLVVDFYRHIGLSGSNLNIRLQQIDGFGRSVHGIYYGVQGTMKSGASDTCLGNSLVNIAAHLWTISIENKCTLEKCWRSLCMSVLGDDNVFTAPPHFTFDKQCQLMADLGLKSKLEIVGPMEYTFLNFIPVPSDQGVRATLKPGRVLSRIQVSDTPQSSFVEYQAGVALGMSKALKDIPVVFPFFQKLSQRSPKTKAIYERYNRRIVMFSRVYTHSSETMERWFVERYGFHPKILQDQLLDFPLVGMFSSSHLKILFEVDGVLSD